MTVPASGLAYVDTACIVYTVEPHPKYAPRLRPLWEAMVEGTVAVVTSELTLMEVVVGAYRAKDPSLEADYRRTLESTGVRLVRIDRDVLDQAAQLRATRPSLRTPDAIHLATATLAGCAVFVTNDKGLRESFSNVVILDDL